MTLKDFENKWNKIFRPDLKLPVHIKRKIFYIYKFQLFEDIIKVVDFFNKGDMNINEKYKNFIDFQNARLII